MRKATLRKLFSAVAFLISLAYLYKNVDFNELAMAIGEANYAYLLLSFLLSILTILLGALRWYLLLRKVQKASFGKTLQAFVSGYYLMAILPPTLGHMAKVKLVGGDYFAALSSLALGMAAEVIVLLSFSLIFLGFTKLGLLGIAIILVAFVYDNAFHRIALTFFKLWEDLGAKRISKTLKEWWHRGYSGWTKAKESKTGFATAFLISLAVIALQVFGLVFVGKAFSLEISVKGAFYAFLMSVLFASLSGIPSGIGANEFGILIGIGPSTKGALTAFLYKFIFQYEYSILGAFVFYKLLGGGYEGSAGQ
ncbi:Putative ABC iron siderophore transporter, fused permease and ATPase domains [Thermococcus sp. 2319x1]|uniref:lysylphosphatidylglycerol synthase domain-containing protein n=1 Tax=Thermococcus sp. 2319x1 TaxID=1674923 RepID=UPI00073A9A1B|nr:lysylphosphatidylglycerol synthase domain-containing protein [Thermococcus sp. 2319x1]ALV62897.1 Putative ABC iron siderophore transporter, fused permease and ATPase domains [Thermococcus sp. 2319x1]